VFEFDASTEMSMTHTQDAQRSGLSVDLHGQVDLQVLERTDDELIVLVSFPETSAEIAMIGGAINESELARFAEQFARPTFVRMSSDGRTLGYRFDAGLELEYRNWIRTLVSGLRFVVPEGAQGGWSVEEEDATGVYAAQYRELPPPNPGAGGRELSKDKLSYLVSEDGGEADDELPAHPVVRGHGRARFDVQIGWLTEVKFDETVQLDLEGFGLEVESRFAIEARLLRVGRSSLADLATVPHEGWSSPDGRVDAVALAQRSEERIAREELEGVRLEDLLATITSLIEGGEISSLELYEASVKLELLLASDPEAVEALREFVLAPGLHPDISGVLLAAAGGAGSPAARALLRDVFSDSELPEVLRLGAVAAVFHLEFGDPATSALLAATGSDLGAGHDLRSTSLLALGALSAQPMLEPGAEGAGIAELLALEDSARADGLTSSWLVALANSRAPESVDAASAYLDHSDPRLRAQAVEVLGSVDLARTTTALVELTRTDASPLVRDRAAAVLSDRGGVEAESALIALASGDPAPRVRETALVGLAAFARQVPGALEQIELASRVDPSAGVRELASSLLAALAR